MVASHSACPRWCSRWPGVAIIFLSSLYRSCLLIGTVLNDACGLACCPRIASGGFGSLNGAEWLGSQYSAPCLRYAVRTQSVRSSRIVYNASGTGEHALRLEPSNDHANQPRQGLRPPTCGGVPRHLT